ncbi:MAG: glycosyltransferase family 4 protein [Nitrosarchaeum sp.]
MKILFVSTGLDTKAGTYEVVSNLSKILLQKHEVSLLTDTKSNIQIPFTKIIKLKTLDFLLPQYRLMPDLRKLLHDHEFDQFDIIHIFEYPLYVTDYLTIKKHQINAPIIISLHGTLHQFNKFPFNLFKKIHNSIMLYFQKRINLFLVSSLSEKRGVIHHGIPEEKIKVLPPAMNIFPIEKRNSSRRKIVYIGRLSKTKNIELLIKAFSKIKTPNVDLIIAGPDFGMLKQLKKITKDSGLENRIFFMGWISEEEKIKLLSETTIFVHPSLGDVFLLSLLEAAAIGIPCVAFDVESNSDILEDNKTGIIVKDISSQGLSEKLDLLLNDNKLYEEISRNSRLILPKKFNWELTTNILEELYSQVIEKA